jgi:hypothetical protein
MTKWPGSLWLPSMKPRASKVWRNSSSMPGLPHAAVDLESDHGKLAVLEAEAGIAGGGEAERRVGPVLDGKNFLSMERACSWCYGDAAGLHPVSETR